MAYINFQINCFLKHGYASEHLKVRSAANGVLILRVTVHFEYRRNLRYSKEIASGFFRRLIVGNISVCPCLQPIYLPVSACQNMSQYKHCYE